MLLIILINNVLVSTYQFRFLKIVFFGYLVGSGASGKRRVSPRNLSNGFCLIIETLRTNECYTLPDHCFVF